MLKELNLENLRTLDDGKVQAAFDVAMKRLAYDCIDRPADSKSRVLTMKVAIKPVLDPDSREAERCRMQITFQEKVPDRTTRVMELGLRHAPNRTGMFVFNEDSPDSVDQATIFDGENE